ncbi:MAG TPA: T9SS type A sorting domain-containing protein, partial [Bacteroidales bacterium]|nr:T9SS type A sorting domain-containing protein [Bacteroidales bacterium]
IAVTVNAITTPTFSFATTYCVGDVADVLPLTSDNSVTGTWDPEVISTAVGTADYTFTPDGAICSEPVVIAVTVNDLPVVTCPADFDVTTIDPVTLTGANPVGGEYTGTGVTDGVFDPDGLGNNDYTITYTYTDPATGCSNFCEFVITLNISYPELDVIDLYSEVEDVEVCLGTLEAEAIALLANEITITNTDDEEFVVTLNWTISFYDPITTGGYTATGTFELPAGVAQTDPATLLEVYALVTVNPLPVVTCPAGFDVVTIDPVTLTGATPVGGEYSGIGVSGGVFDPAGVPLGACTIYYNYTDPTTGCENECSFVINLDIPYPEITGIDIYDDVDDVDVCLGANEADALALLVNQITIENANSEEYNVTLTWTIDAFDGNTPGDYDATGTFTLPAGVSQTDPETPLEVTAIVTVNELPVVTCPADDEITTSEVIALSGASPEGGTYSGTGVVGSDFDPSSLDNGDYIITYTYTDPVTGCTNFCEFTLTLNITNPQIAGIDVNDDVEDIEVCLGTEEAIAIAALASQITITDTEATEYLVDVTWTIDTYDGNTAADYNATGTFELPVGVNQTDPVTPLEVTAVVTVNELPVVDCPDNFSVTTDDVVALTGATPEGGTYSGSGVTGSDFDPSALANGDYIITYTYTDAVTGCTNTCEFTITVDIDNNIITNNATAISVYPNPNNGLFNLNFVNVNGNVNYQIYDTKGSIIVDETIFTNGNTNVEVSLDITPGVYYVKMITETQTLVEKLVIE